MTLRAEERLISLFVSVPEVKFEHCFVFLCILFALANIQVFWGFSGYVVYFRVFHGFPIYTMVLSNIY